MSGQEFYTRTGAKKGISLRRPLGGAQIPLGVASLGLSRYWSLFNVIF